MLLDTLLYALLCVNDECLLLNRQKAAIAVHGFQCGGFHHQKIGIDARLFFFWIPDISNRNGKDSYRNPHGPFIE